MKRHLPALARRLAALLLGAVALAAAAAGGDAKRGADTFIEECGDCHSAAAGKNKKGPSLVGVIGRPAAAMSSFGDYSDAMKRLGTVWTVDRIDAYLAQPRKVVPGGKMKYDGLEDAQARADVIAYLSTLK